MTREEAIRLLDLKTCCDAIQEIEYYGGFNGKEAAIKATNEACVIAVDAMRFVEDLIEYIAFLDGDIAPSAEVICRKLARHNLVEIRSSGHISGGKK